MISTMANIISLEEKRQEIKTSKKSLYNMIRLILDGLRERSENTASSYEGYYREFFKITLGKEMEDVTWEDLISITYEKVLGYCEKLKKNNINKTINIKVASLKTLYRELYKADRRVDILAVEVNKLPEDEDESITYGSLTEEEIHALFDYCLNLPHREKPLIKKLFFETAYITAIRVGALLNLKWENIKRVKDKDGLEMWVIKVKDKGSVTTTPITDEFYEKLCELKSIVHSDGLRDKPTDRVFNVTKKTLAKTLKDFCEAYGIDESRNIVLHSLKKASIDKVYYETRDINKTARHGHHKGVEMVYKHYQGKNEKLSNRPSYALFGEEQDLSKLEEATKEQLIEAIRKCGKSIINEVISNL